MSEFNRQIVNPNDAKVNANHLRIKGVMLRGEISHFDIPKEIVAKYNSEKKLFQCDLIYLTSEPLTPQLVMKKENSNLYFYFGKNSGKIYRIEIENIEKSQIPDITIEVNTALNNEIVLRTANENFDKVPIILNLMSAQKALEKTHIFSSFSLK